LRQSAQIKKCTFFVESVQRRQKSALGRLNLRGAAKKVHLEACASWRESKSVLFSMNPFGADKKSALRSSKVKYIG